MIAKQLGLAIYEKPDSQDICFVNNGSYSDVIRRYYPNTNLKGDIVDLEGKKLGTHDGIINYTVGQRRKLEWRRYSPTY